MSLLRRALAPIAISAVAVAGAFTPTPAAASEPVAGAVYVLGNQVSGNEVLEFERAADGTLSAPHAFETGGTGTGAGLGSQGAVVLDEEGQYLYAVNAGSDSITSFRVLDHGLRRVDVVSSGGDQPTSLTVHDGFVYVLNAGGDGNIHGFTVRKGDLTPLAGSARALSGTATAPAQVSFSPDGGQLVVAERATQKLDLYSVGDDGYVTDHIVASSAGVTPFGFGFDKRDHLIVSEAFGGAANASAVSSYNVEDDALEVVSASVPTTETAACWIAITGKGKFAYAGNAGTNSVTGYRIAQDGSLTTLDADGKTGSALAGVTDLALSSDSAFLYGRLGNGTVGAWAVNEDGSLADVGAFPGLPARPAGIAAR